MAGRCHWPIGGGETLEFEIVAPYTAWNDVPGLYIFAREDDSNWHALYVGQAESFATSLANHGRWIDAVRRGATHIHARVVPRQYDRNLWEGALIRTLQPILNSPPR
jgi:excinuclease UvrABC nuclease subunit